jgi:hypothetical protein
MVLEPAAQSIPVLKEVPVAIDVPPTDVVYQFSVPVPDAVAVIEVLPPTLIVGLVTLTLGEEGVGNTLNNTLLLIED